MAFDLAALRRMEEERNDWLHQVIEDDDVGRANAGQPPPVDADAMINDSDDNAIHAYTNFTCAEFYHLWTVVAQPVSSGCSGEFGPSPQPRLGS